MTRLQLADLSNVPRERDWKNRERREPLLRRRHDEAVHRAEVSTCRLMEDVKVSVGDLNSSLS
jgi:hypothetical protein